MTPPSVRIRTYEPRDYEQVWALHLEGVQDTRTSQYPAVDPAYEDDLRRIEEEYLSPGCCFWVAEDGERLVGMTAIRRIDKETARLRRMRVTGGWRRRGVGQMLLETAERFCREAGYRRLILDSTEQQTAAHRLYQRNGFVRTGEHMVDPFRVFDFEKELA
jgi:GNAT superfamily N-acetyltransferase